MNKLMKVLEDKRVEFESSYYDPHDDSVPQYIKHLLTKEHLRTLSLSAPLPETLRS